MDNLKLPAYPVERVHFDSAYECLYSAAFPANPNGFTKLELASLMMAQGMLSGWWNDGLSEGMRQALAKDSVAAAKAIIEEANK